MTIEPDLLEKFIPSGTYRNHREEDARIRRDMEERLRRAELDIKELQTERDHTEDHVKAIETGNEKRDDRRLILIGLWSSVLLGLFGLAWQVFGK